MSSKKEPLTWVASCIPNINYSIGDWLTSFVKNGTYDQDFGVGVIQFIGRCHLYNLRSTLKVFTIIFNSTSKDYFILETKGYRT